MISIDALFALFLLAGMPLASYRLDQTYLRKFGDTPTASQVAVVMRSTHILLWGGCAAAIGFWAFSGREVADIALSLPRLGEDTALTPLIGWGMAAGICISQTIMLGVAWFNPTGMVKAIKDLEKTNLIPYLPKTKAQMRRWVFTSFTAGFTEEVIWRGVALTILGGVMPLWAAAGLSLISFTLGHLYQSTGGIIRVILIGAMLTAITLLSQSLIPAIITHFMIDLGAGFVTYQAFKGQRILEAEAPNGLPNTPL